MLWLGEFKSVQRHWAPGVRAYVDACLAGRDGERPGDRGHAPGFAEVRLSAPAPVGTIQPVRITHTQDDHLIGVPE